MTEPRDASAQDWISATRRLAAGEATLVSLWGDAGCVRMAVHERERAELTMLALPCPDGAFPSVGAVHPPAIRLVDWQVQAMDFHEEGILMAPATADADLQPKTRRSRAAAHDPRDVLAEQLALADRMLGGRRAGLTGARRVRHGGDIAERPDVRRAGPSGLVTDHPVVDLDPAALEPLGGRS